MKKSFFAVLLALMTTFLTADDKTPTSATAPNTPPAPPAAKKVHTENRINGGDLVDDYAWMRDKSNPEVAQYLQAENAYADGVMKPTEALQQRLYDEMISHLKETDVNVPYRQGGYFHYSRWEKGQQYQIYARKKGTLDAPEEVTLDQNELAKNEKFMALAVYDPSHAATLLAHPPDTTVFPQY